MTYSKMIKILDAEQVSNVVPEGTIESIFATDMMSEVLTLQGTNIALLTTLNNPQVIRTAEMQDLYCVCFVFGKNPSEETIALAREKEIPVIRTTLSLFDACGKLFQGGGRGSRQRE